MHRLLGSVVVFAGCTSHLAPAPVSASSPEHCKDLTSCERACTAAGTDSCVTAASQMREHPSATDARRYARVLDGACNHGHEASCLVLGNLLTGTPTLAPDVTGSRAAYERGCKLGDGVACMNAGQTEAVGSGLLVLAHARALMTTRCDAHDGRSCAVLAILALAVDQAPGLHKALEARAADYLEASCAAGVVDQCMAAARQIDGIRIDGVRVEGSPTRIKKLLDRGCELGEGEACMLIASNAPDLDAAARTAMLQRACNLGRPEACLVLGKEALDAKEPTARPLLDRGLALAQALCNLSEASACDTLADSLALEGVPAEQAARNADLVERVCDLHRGMTCNQLAEALKVAPALPHDGARIASLKTRACTYGYPFACPDPAAAMGMKK